VQSTTGIALLVSESNIAAIVAVTSNVGIAFNDSNGWNGSGGGGIQLSNLYDTGASGFLSVNSNGQLLWNGYVIA
jgi:hypothetical protein